MVKVKERENINVDKALRLIRELEENGPMKPWTLVSRVKAEDEEFEEIRINVLKPLALKGYIMPDADGDIYVDSRRNFRQDYVE